MARKLQVQPLVSPLSAKQIGNKLATIRRSKGFTQTQLAQLIGIRQRLVSDYETGRTSISAEMLSRFCYTLKCSASDIITVKFSKEKTNLRLSKRFHRIENLSLNHQKVLLQTIDNYIKGVSMA
jgi:transcriptional regulator with XRE-family HTH domain